MCLFSIHVTFAACGFLFAEGWPCTFLVPFIAEPFLAQLGRLPGKRRNFPKNLWTSYWLPVLSFTGWSSWNNSVYKALPCCFAKNETLSLLLIRWTQCTARVQNEPSSSSPWLRTVFVGSLCCLSKTAQPRSIPCGYVVATKQCATGINRDSTA